MGFQSKKNQKNEENALRYVERLLRYRLRSEKELRYRLRSKGFSEDLIEDVIEKLKKSEIVNDETFAYMFAKSELEVKYHGPYMIRRKLRELGVDPDIVDRAVEKAWNEYDFTELVRKWYSKYDGDLKKLKEALYRRGFDPSIIEDVDLEIDRR